VAAQPPDDTSEKMKVWERLQGVARPEEPKAPEPEKEETRIGFLPEGVSCSRCSKVVVRNGGVYCSRKMPDKTVRGCFEQICWKCMNKGGKDFGTIKCTKAEFAEMGEGAWWMHEKCMTPEDKRAYFGEEEDTIAAPKDKEDSEDEDEGGTFAWE